MNYPLSSIRQLAADLVAHALCDLFPRQQIITTTTTSEGFYCEVTYPHEISSDTLTPLIEERVRALTKAEIPVRQLEMMRENAELFFKQQQKQPFIAAAIAAIPDNIVSVVQIGDFFNNSPATPLQTTNDAGAIKLLSVEKGEISNARGNTLATIRIWGTAHHNPQSLKKFLKSWHHAQKINHRTLGANMALFKLAADANGIDNALWLPKGATIRTLLQQWWQQAIATLTFDIVATPPLLDRRNLSALKSFKATNFPPSLDWGNGSYLFAPPRAAHHANLYSASSASPHEGSIRYAEWCQGFCDLPPLQQCGLLNSISYTHDQCHIFTPPNLLQEEIISCLQLIGKTVSMMGFKHYWRLSLYRAFPSEHSADRALLAALEACGIDFCLMPERRRLGPCAEIVVTDTLGREWPGPSVAIFPALAGELGLLCVDSRGRTLAPVVVALTLFASLERAIALLLEQAEGDLPLWLMPEQVRVIAIGSDGCRYADQLQRELQAKGWRVTVDASNSPLAAKVHAAESARVPYNVIVGANEALNNTVALRFRGVGQKKQQMSFTALIQKLEAENRAMPALNVAAAHE